MTRASGVMRTEQIFVALLGDGVEAWRPVQAKKLHGNVYRIVDQPYDRETETWQFEPGANVVCELVDASGGRMLAATERADS